MPMIPAKDLPNEGQGLKPGDTVELTVKSVDNGQVEFEYPATDPATPEIPEDVPDDKKPFEGKDIPTKEQADKMSVSDLRSKLPVKSEEY